MRCILKSSLVAWPGCLAAQCVDKGRVAPEKARWDENAQGVDWSRESLSRYGKGKEARAQNCESDSR
jgi:hypothetical protein